MWGGERATGVSFCLCPRSVAECPVPSLGFSRRREQAEDTDAGAAPICARGSTGSDWRLLRICWWWPADLFVVVTVTQWACTWAAWLPCHLCLGLTSVAASGHGRRLVTCCWAVCRAASVPPSLYSWCGCTTGPLPWLPSWLAARRSASQCTGPWGGLWPSCPGRREWVHLSFTCPSPAWPSWQCGLPGVGGETGLGRGSVSEDTQIPGWERGL